MQNFTIRGKKENKGIYRVPTSLKDISLERLILYQQEIESQKPQSLFTVESADLTPENVLQIVLSQPAEERAKWLEFYRKQVCYWCDMDISVAQTIKDIDIVGLRNMIVNMFNDFVYDPNVRKFEHAGANYIISNRYMEGSVLIEFIESMEYEHRYQNAIEAAGDESEYGAYIRSMKYNRLSILPKIMCLLCKQEIDGLPEQYHDLIVEKHEADMLKVNCEVALNVAFFLQRQKIWFTKDFPTFLTRHPLKLLKQVCKN